jgi:hypothetical protein
MDSDERDHVAALVLNARTLEECRTAETALRDWLCHNPQDWAMYDLVSTLATFKAAAVEQEGKGAAGVAPYKAVA